MWWPIRAGFKRSAAALALAAFLGAAGPSAAPPAPAGFDYAGIFGRDYTAALEFAAGHAEADAVFRSWEIPPAFAWAIVFPELIRYSALADVLETGNLKVLYVQFGKGYGDFSVGHFQMKPSFAETLEGDFLRLADPRPVARIGQALYLAMFVRVLDKLYAGQIWMNLEDKLRFYATAYNAGYRLGASRIRRESAVPRFHTGLFAGKTVYAYSDIAADFFHKRESVR
jgi:hypothetical protein